MTGYNLVQKIRRFEQRLDQLGMRMGHPRHSNGSWGEVLALMPKDEDALPVYARDAELFIGTLEQAEEWLNGIEWARQYDQLLRLSNDKKRARKEQDQRNRNLLAALKAEGANISVQ